MTSSPVSLARVGSITNQNVQGTSYSVLVSPPVARVQQNDLAAFDVKVVRGSEVGQFSIHLSLVSDSSILKTAASFDPPILNFRQGQTFANATLRVNSQDFELGAMAFRVQATTQPPTTPDNALSNPATIIIGAAEPESKSTSPESLPSERTPTSEPIPSKLNSPPVAKAGPDQLIEEGKRGVLDGSASIDKDKDPLSFVWQQISPRQPIIKLYPSDVSSKVSFVAPEVNKDTLFTFNLVVKDTNGGRAVDSMNVLTTNVEESKLPNLSPTREGNQTQNQQNQQSPPSQEPTLNPGTSSNPTSNQVPTSTENHSPTSEAQQVLLTDEAKSLSITLKGNDPDKGDKISYVILSNPTHGTIAGFDKTTGSLTYLPTSGFVGQDRLTYKVKDSHDAESNVGMVLVRVKATGQPVSSPVLANATVNNSSLASRQSPSPSEPSSSLTPVKDNQSKSGNATAALAQSMGTLAVDDTPPTVVLFHPDNQSTNNPPLHTIIYADFSEPVKSDTVNSNTFKVFRDDCIEGCVPVEVSGTLAVRTDGIRATFTPTPDPTLATSTTYHVKINTNCSPDLEGSPCIMDLAGNAMQTGYPWSFTTSAADISMTLSPPSQKWGYTIEGNIHVEGQGEGDTISINWGDGTTADVISAPSGGDAKVPHVYSKDAATSPAKTVVAKLLTPDPDGPVERASTQVSTTIQKHATSLTLDMRPSPADNSALVVCNDCHFTTFGKLVDKDVVSDPEFPTDPEIPGKTITFSGSGATPLPPSVPTEGLTFSGDSNNDLTLTSSALRMHVGASADLSYSGVSASGVTLNFEGASGSSVGVTLTKVGGGTLSMTVPVGSSQNANFAKGFSKLTITSVDGSSSPSQYGDLATIITRDMLVSPDEQFEIHFNNVVPTPGQYPVLVINPGSYFAAGITQHNDANGLKVKAQFDGTSDPAYASPVNSPEISYSVSSSAAGTGDSDTTPDDTSIWTTLTVGTQANGINGDVCTFNGVAGADADKDGICDRWEDPNNSAIGNTASHRYVVCPSTGPNFAAAIDPSCPVTAGDSTPNIKYDLCSAGCPTLGKRDIYVEIDSKSGFVPSDTAINNVIQAFAHAPASTNAPAGITLHVIKDGTISTIPNNLFVWKDPSSLNFNDNVATNDFFNVKKTNFGTSTERGGTSGMPGMTAAGWSSTGKTQKHYVYHYGLSVNFYSKTNGLTCPSTGLSSGVGEVLGNDFVISLGCGWGTFDSTGATARSNDQQAGTIMHELGHNLALHHGGPATAKLGSRTVADYKMNCKGGYFSVMNYERQMPWDLAGTAGTLDSTDLANWEGVKINGLLNFRQDATKFSTMLDYAATTAPQQNEGALNEAGGLAAADLKTYHVIYLKTNAGKATVAADHTVNPTTGARVTKLDLNGDGSYTTPAGDINNVGSPVAGCGPLSPEVENSYNDWNEINLVFLPDGDSVDGVTKQISDPYIGTIEVTPSYGKAIAAKAHTLDIQFIPPPATDGSTTFNLGATVPFKFRLTDINGSPIKNAAVTLVVQTIPANPNTPPTTLKVQPFVYSPSQNIYQTDLKTTSAMKGPLAISYYKDYQKPNQVLFQGPEAQASGSPYTLKITGK
jgi:Bacterial Ig-like domain/Bacterial Ig domain